jgi:DNA-binding MarR family transcriptional regulator/GNAT superfamily N-acetyltransferase
VPSRFAAAARVRQFNRFYTRRMGLLRGGLLQSRFSLAEVRVLYEIAHLSQPTARLISTTLGIDEGHLSRLLRQLRARGLVSSRASTSDRRRRILALTARGQKAFAGLNSRATGEVAEMLQPLSPTDRQQLLASLAAVEELLSQVESRPQVPEVVLRAPEPGDLGWVVQRHGELYAEEYGWSADFERLVAKIVGDFAASDSIGNRCWIATLDGERAGCVFLVPASSRVAKLRLLLVEPWARGVGLGTRLVEACIAAAREDGYRTLTLWTNDVLVAARRLYEKEGFRLVKSERHQSFGKSLVGQNWELSLRP